MFTKYELHHYDYYLNCRKNTQSQSQGTGWVQEGTRRQGDGPASASTGVSDVSGIRESRGTQLKYLQDSY